ncbi:unnamed protein product [Nippostrongylus brasiliensis]|uniref:Twin-arginine translocase subunit TatC n=1 Tax=Nippostrongylus brasiliensis TaxID=27835 RepID=A0A0N4XER5_NIPBR|nr:unnamed protein product [Nippostrongylus brasiliensis]
MDTNDIVLRRVSPQIRSALVLVGGLFAMLSFGLVYTFGEFPHLFSVLKMVSFTQPLPGSNLSVYRIVESGY